MTGTEMAARPIEPERDAGAGGADEAELNATFGIFCQENLVKVHRFLLSYCRASDLVDDAVQEAFLAARGRWAEIRNYDKPVAWVFKAAIIKERKLRERRNHRESIGLDDVPPERLAAPADGHEARLVLQQLLRRLPRQLAAITQLDVDGWKAEEIAGILGLTVNTVRTYKRRAHQQLRQLVETADSPAGREGGPDGS